VLKIDIKAKCRQMDLTDQNVDKIKVLYIAGMGRSGTTILGNILGQLNGFFYVGEFRAMWRRALIEKRFCGCGVPFIECEMWRRILDESLGGIDQIDIHHMFHLIQHGTRTHHIPLMLMPWGKQWLKSYLSKYLDNSEKIYQAIHSITNSKVIVDSSKFPSYAYILKWINAIDLYVIHLVRDSRGVTFSWLKKKNRQETKNLEYLKQRNPLMTSMRWNMRNLASEVMFRRFSERYLLVHYEDVIDKPKEVIMRILRLIREKPSDFSFLTENGVNLRVNHSVSGNPNRFQTGDVKLQRDEEWKVKMKRIDKIIVTMLTWPLLWRYGYFSK